jgi:hypothetical protein
MLDAEKYIHEKKAEMKEARLEIVGLFDLIKRQRHTIEQVEAGAYDGGVKSYNIPKEDKVHFPNREGFPL